MFTAIKLWQLVAIGAVVLGGGAYGVYALVIQDDDDALSEDQQVIPVQLGDLINRVSTNGSLLYPNREVLSFGSQGTIAEVLVGEGEEVEEGQPLVILDAATVGALMMHYMLESVIAARLFAVNPFDRAEIVRLGEFIASIDADPVLVLAAGLDAIEAAEIAESFADLGANRMITTRIDQTRRLGSVLSAAHVGGLAIADAGVTPHVADGLTALNPVSLARLLCRNPDTPDAAYKEVSE